MTLVNADILEEYLKKSNYDQKESDFLVNGFATGLTLGMKAQQTDRILLRIYHYDWIQSRNVGEDHEGSATKKGSWSI